MPEQQRMIVFYAAIVAAVVLTIVAITYLAGTAPFSADGRHGKHAILFFALAIGALVVANFNRPGVPARR